MRTKTYVERQFLTDWRETWINQPSTLQRWNVLHGLRVYARLRDDGRCDILYQEPPPFNVYVAPIVIDANCLA